MESNEIAELLEVAQCLLGILLRSDEDDVVKKYTGEEWKLMP